MTNVIFHNHSRLIKFNFYQFNYTFLKWYLRYLWKTKGFFGRCYPITFHQFKNYKLLLHHCYTIGFLNCLNWLEWNTNMFPFGNLAITVKFTVSLNHPTVIVWNTHVRKSSNKGYDYIHNLPLHWYFFIILSIPFWINGTHYFFGYRSIFLLIDRCVISRTPKGTMAIFFFQFGFIKYIWLTCYFYSHFPVQTIYRDATWLIIDHK